MKTNYAQHLALFQYNVRSNVISDHDKNARCWHASIRKPVIYHYPTSEPCESKKGTFFFLDSFLDFTFKIYHF